jgi:phenylacetate-CoA ligase
VAVLRGNVIVPLTTKSPPFWRHNYFHNHLLLSNFHLSPVNLPSYFGALRAFRPVVLDGYPSSVYVLAKALLGAGQTLPIKAVLTSSETLYDFQREVIEKAFQCRVFDYFGAAERVIFSVECERHEGHHLCEEYGVTEVVDQDGIPVGPDTEGTLVGTTLHNFGFPLIRYRTNDRCARKSAACSCGRGLPLMEDVTTKAEDLIRLRDGRFMSPSALTHPFKPLDSIEASQLVQPDLDRLVVRIIRRDGFSDADRSHLVTELKARLGQDMRIEIEFVASLPRTASGKFKWVISEVPTGL